MKVLIENGVAWLVNQDIEKVGYLSREECASLAFSAQFATQELDYLASEEAFATAPTREEKHEREA